MSSGPNVPAGYSLACFDEIDSTNAEALRQAETGVHGPLWIIAKHQNLGRGRRGRTWITTSGNLFSTLLLNWRGPQNVLSDLSFVTAVTCAEMAREMVENSPGQSKITLKWPNDVLLDKAKVGGILIETSNLKDGSTAVAIGIGINVASHPAEDLGYRATNFSEHRITLSAVGVFEQLAIHFDHQFALWQGGTGFTSIKKRWLGFGPAVGENLTINTGKDVITGAFAGLEERGGLQIQLPDGAVQTILAGDILSSGDEAFSQKSIMKDTQ